MDLHDRIPAVLGTKDLDDREFERCAYHFLMRSYPRLTPIAGAPTSAATPTLIPFPTGSACRDDGPPLANLKRGLKRMKVEGSRTKRAWSSPPLVWFTAPSARYLEKAALTAGSHLIQVHDRSWLEDQLQHDNSTS